MGNDSISKKIVFVSHIKEEQELALQVKNFIEDAFLGIIEVFVSSDENSIPLGQKWLDDITEALKCCIIEIVICSPKSVERPWINFEAGAGWIRDIPVIPLCHSGIQPSNLPMPLNLLQAANLNSIFELKLLLPILAKIIDSSVPKYDFTDFVEKVKKFEKNYTFWDECKYCFSLIKRYSGGTGYMSLLSGNSIDFYVPDIEKEYFHKIIPFLKERNILDCRPVGSNISGNGISTKYRLLPLSDFLRIVKDEEFSRIC
jgi:hypothetical protein